MLLSCFRGTMSLFCTQGTGKDTRDALLHEASLLSQGILERARKVYEILPGGKMLTGREKSPIVLVMLYFTADGGKGKGWDSKQIVKWNHWFKKPTRKLTLTRGFALLLAAPIGRVHSKEPIPVNASGLLVCPSKQKCQFAAKGVDSPPSIPGLAGSRLEINHTLIKTGILPSHVIFTSLYKYIYLQNRHMH